MRARGLTVPLLCSLAIVAGAPAALAGGTSLYSGPGPRPGPDVLYGAPAVAPQLENVGVWSAAPILVSGASAYRGGEFLYQGFRYDDHGAAEAPDPTDPRSGGNLFSKPDGTYTYPTDPGYANDAADLVELRLKPLSDATAFRLTLNTMKDPSLVAFSIAIGGTPGVLRSFPAGANVRAPADLFLTVHPAGAGMAGDLVDAATGQPVGGPALVAVDTGHRQIEVRVPHAAWDPGGQVVRLAAGVGLWEKASGRYLLPQAAADATHPGGAGTAVSPAAFFNVAFRYDEPMPEVGDPTGTATGPAWWRDKHQGEALAAGDISAPESRGPDGFSDSYAGADVFEVWADVASRYRLDPDWAVITGYSMGGIGTFKLAEQFPDLFARGQPTVGFSADNNLVASLRNIPFLMWNSLIDELVPPTDYVPTAEKFDSLGYRYELDVFTPGDHLTLPLNDQFAPAAAFLDLARVNRNPAHVTYVVDPTLDYPALGFVADHAYWLSGIELRSSTPPVTGGHAQGSIDALSYGFGTGDPTPSDTQFGTGTLTGGNLPTPLVFTRQFRTWGPVPSIPRLRRIDLAARNITAVTINVRRANVGCGVDLHVDTDGPMTIELAGCGRTIAAGGGA